MKVIIPHQTEELKIIHAQKLIIQNLNVSSPFLYANFPLWIDSFFDDELPLKSQIKLITKITINPPKITQNLKKNENLIYCDVQIHLKESVINSKLELCNLLQNITNDDFSSINKQFLQVDFSDFPSQLKIFRLGELQHLQKNSIAISDFCWCKLR